MAGDIDNIFAFGAQQQVEMYNRIASYKEKQAAHEMLASKVLHENSQLALRHTIQAMRPTMMLRPLVARSDDGGWTATYGECQGSGPTPDLACQDFDIQWTGKDG